MALRFSVKKTYFGSQLDTKKTYLIPKQQKRLQKYPTNYLLLYTYKKNTIFDAILQQQFLKNDDLSSLLKKTYFNKSNLL